MIEDDRLGATLIECNVCGVKLQPLVWVNNFGWACSSCGSGLHGPDQKPTICKTIAMETGQRDLFG